MRKVLCALIQSGQLGLPFEDYQELQPEEGSFSIIYAARCSRRNVPVILKFVHPHLASEQPIRHKAFLREASILKELSGSNNVCELTHELASINYTVAIPDLPEFVVQFQYFGLAAYPETLLRVIRQGSRDLDSMLGIFRGVVRGVMWVHRAGICHRDLKPSNCFVSVDDGYVGDFGCARRNSRDDDLEDSDRYRNWWIWGDLRYVAPEIFFPHRAFASFLTADFYSLGCILYEIATGEILADQIPEALTKLEHLHRLSSGPMTSRVRGTRDAILADLDKSGHLPAIPLQRPITTVGAQRLLQDLYQSLCAFDPAKRLVDFDELFRRVDVIRRQL